MGHRVVFFDEGPGFIFVKALGKGVYGSASLVSCVRDGKYYVRKEDLRLEDTDSGKPNREVRNASKAACTGATAKVQGWANYRSLHNGKTFTVTYWDYYTAGTLGELLTKSVNNHIVIPEAWIALWAMVMLETILDLHLKAEITHQDGHLNNWFLSSCWQNGVPKLGVGDFGLARQRPHCDDKWFNACLEDFKMVHGNLRSLLAGRRESYLYGLLENMSNYMQRARGVKTLHQHMAHIYNVAEVMMEDRFPRPTEAQKWLIKEDIPHGGCMFRPAFRPYEDPRDPAFANLKYFLVAEVSNGDSIYIKGQPKSMYGQYEHVLEDGWTQRGKYVFHVTRR